MLILLYAMVALGYLLLAARGWIMAGAVDQQAVARTADGVGHSGGFAAWERIALAAIWVLHFLLIRSDFESPEGVRFGFALALSATMWLAVAVFWIESLFFSLASMRLLILPIALLCALLPAWFPGSAALTSTGLGGNPAFEAHLVVALSAYGLITIAALHALLMMALDRWLHKGEVATEASTALWARVEQAVLRQLPPLLTMERLLFRLVGLGFALLTLTVLTGVVFSERLFGRPMSFDQKTVFTLVSWFIFAALLTGRALYGWRGRVALRWTLSGFVAMLLAYAGSRFILEVVLHQV